MIAVRRALFCLGLVLALGCCGRLGNQDRLAEARAGGSVRIGITGTSPPWSSFNEQHEPVGYDVAVARELASRLGIAHPVFVPDSFKNFVEGLRTDKYDLVLNDLTPTPERAEQVDFGIPYGVEDLRLFVVADNSSIKGRDDLAGRRVGVTTGSSNEAWTRRFEPRAIARGYENGALAFRDLSLGRIDAAVFSHFAGLKYAREEGLEVREVGPPLSFQLSAPAMAKDQPKLRSAVNVAISQMRSSGEIDRIAMQWVGVDYVMSQAIRIGEREAAEAPRPPTSPGSGLSKVLHQSLPMLGPAVAITLWLGFSSFILGSVLGMLVALMRVSGSAALRWIGFAYVSVFRGTPLLVQLLLIYFGLPELGVQLAPIPAAMLALTVFAAAYLSENFRAGILAVDRGQSEAATSLGMGYWLTMRRVILPQAFRIALPATGSRLIALMKDTSLASVVTVAELTRLADEVGATTFRYVEAFLVVGLIYWIINQLLTIGQLALEHRLSRHLR